ncbi:MAG: efflux RND transporter periplasmic adaptor subunit [Desulfobulbaceae bacterium]|nr:efflux RND transporter periplasmic adaptor subunit [Desulfobulbaceae bacterium]
MKKNKYTYIFLLLALFALIAAGGCDSAGNATASPAAIEKDGHDHDEHTGDAEHDERDDHDAKEEHGADSHDDVHGEAVEGGHEDVVQLSEAERNEFGIEVSIAGPGRLTTFINLPGEIVINSDTMAHIVPRVSGIVRHVYKKLGDTVEAGEVLAELESRELAEMKVSYLSALERFNLAKELFDREEKLWNKKITAEQDFLTTRQVMAEARIELRSAEQKLHSLGFTEQHLASQKNHPDITFTRYKLTAPFEGTVIEKHITLGETVKDDSEVFIIADLRTVWADINIYQKDLPFIKKGQAVEIDQGHDISPVTGVISYVGPIIGESTRTAPARIVLDNLDGNLRPGIFITAQIATGDKEVSLLIPRSSLQTFEGKQVVFVLDEDGFEPRPVTIGQTSSEQVEVIEGLQPGDSYVSKGAFTLKAQLSKGAFGDGHNH